MSLSNTLYRFDLNFTVTLVCRATSQDLFTTMGAMYGAVLFLGINNCGTVQPMVDIERTVLYREQAAGMYSAIPYALAQVRLHSSRLSVSSSMKF